MQEEYLLKTAHLLGVTRAMLEQGYTFAGVKQAYVNSGMFPEFIADDLVKSAAELDLTKEAALPAIAAIGAKVAPWLLRGAKAIGQFAGRMGGKLIGKGGTVAPAVGRGVIGAGKAVGQGLKGLATNPGATMWSGTKNFGKGLFFGGQGVGGAAGKAVAIGGMASGLLGGGRAVANHYGGQQQMPMQQNQYGGY
jgi:hypothetical protein